MTTANLPAIRACRPALNKGRVVGQKRPLLPKHVWAIRVRLEIAENHRDLALFNLAIDSKLRGCDLVKMKVAEVYSAGQVKERASIIQSKTRSPVRFEITEGTRKSILRWMDDPLMIGSEYLLDFTPSLVRASCDLPGWWTSPRLWSGLHATFRAGFSWAAKALGVKFPSAECGRSSL